MANSIKWPKEIRDKARAEGKRLVAFGTDGLELVGMADRERAGLMSLIYIHFICNGTTLTEAIEKAKAAYPSAVESVSARRKGKKLKEMVG